MCVPWRNEKNILNDITSNLTPASPLTAADARPLYPELSAADAEIHEWQSNSSFYVAPSNTEDPEHIVDMLIRERAPKLSRSRLWPHVQRVLFKMLGYQIGVDLVNTAGRMSATEAFAFASEKMGVQLEATGTRHIPKTGGFILALNHPTGVADGLAAHDLLMQIRPDPIVFVNGDAIRLNPRMTEKLIPVEWHEDKKNRAKSRETFKATRKAFAEGRAIILFPSGRLAYMDKNNKLRERPWMASVAVLAKKYNVAVVPTRLDARNSALFYLLSKINLELRDMTIFREWFNKRGKTFTFAIQAPIQPEELLDDNDAAAAELQQYVEEGISHSLDFRAWRKLSGTAKNESTGHAVRKAKLALNQR